MSTHISQIILDKIQKEKIQPTPKWYFVAEHAVLWIPGVIVTFLGALAVAGILYSFIHSGWEYSEFVYPSQVDFLIEAMPFLWILSFILFNSVIVKALRTTHSGYRLSVKGILLGSVTASIFLGIGIYLCDEVFEANSIIRYQVQMRERQISSAIEKGRLIGLVEKKYQTSLLVRDRDNILWNVDLSLLGTSTFVFIQEGKSITIIGTTTDENSSNENNDNSGEDKEKVFIACAIFPKEVTAPVRSSSTQKVITHRPRVHTQSNNPDCKVLLNEIKKNIRSNASQHMKEIKP